MDEARGFCTRAHNGLTRRRLLTTLSAGGATLALAGCGTSGSNGGGGDEPVEVVEVEDFSTRFAAYEPADEPNRDPSRVTWPDWLDQFDPEVKRLYEFQIVNGELMRWMPCFCGCRAQGAPGDGHRNNRDCYVEAVNPDGSVVFDSMAPT
jgi:hypothetical protein